MSAEPQWTSPHIGELFLGSLLPASFILIAIINDLLKAIPVSKRFRMNWLYAPFQNFITKEDVINHAYPGAKRRFVLKTRILAGFAYIASIGWLGWLVYQVTSKDTKHALNALVGLITWVRVDVSSLIILVLSHSIGQSYVSLSISTKPPSTPPYILMAFACTNVLFFLVDLGFHFMGEDKLKARLILDVFGMVIPGAFVWMAGTLPLQAVRVAPNIAGPKDIPSNSFSCPEDDVTLWEWGDSYAVAQRFWEFSGIFASPVRLTIALVFLYQILGWSALSGVVVILLAYVLNYPLATYNVSITRSSWKAKDTRMNIVNELLQNIRFLKFYGWGQRLTVSKAFTSIALFSQLQEPMTALPGQIFAMLHAYVSMQRIEGFLDEGEVPEWASTLTAYNDENSRHEIGFTSGVFQWPALPKSPSPARFVLGPLDIKFPIGRLTLVSGATGSGKSALLAALLGEMRSAVDMHTAQHLLTKCLSGELAQDRTIILVTHHISLCLPAASYIVELAHGQVLQQGSIEDLKDLGLLNTIIQQEGEVSGSTVNALENETEILKDIPSIKQPQTGSGKLVEAEARAEARWGEAYQSQDFAFIISSFLPPYPWAGLPPPDINVTPWLMIYFYISLLGASSVLLYIALGYYASLKASRSLFIHLLKRMTRAPARFFDVTPIGRILNRFTTDINIIDGALMNSVRNCISGVLNFLASFTVILVVVPTFAPFALFIAWLYIRLAPPYIQASRDLRRLESVSLSPAFAGYDELLRGIAHIRAFGMENRYQDGFYAKVIQFLVYSCLL
ncbi:hypothetical protein H0H81_000287 [Sphagnurus paluster]|uniref:ABC transmembrane type-1 domain-containing protein n=1 Tax=Sphagnurus paluster TaxID=117069 RepID=A0A9P7FWC9_9AGAR|nr:hypothetical protein H0H81_000287 [Sphagnurus paluster]